MTQAPGDLMETQDVSLEEMSDTPMTIQIGERELNLNRLKLRDYTIAGNYLRLQRGRAARNMLIGALGRPLTMEEDIRLATETASQPITMTDIVGEFDSRCQLIARGVVGNPGIKPGEALAWVLDNIDPSDDAMLVDLINKITGAYIPLANSKAGSDENQSTQTTSSLSSGTDGSLPSAGSTG